MNPSRAAPSCSVTLDQLIALNEEMAALVRAGVPLEKSLVEMAHDLHGKQGALAEELGARLAQGESLLKVVADDTSRLPKLWRSVVQAGLRSGNLSAALQGLATTGRHVAELRRAKNLAAIYPALLLLVTYVLTVTTTSQLLPEVEIAYQDLGSRTPLLIALLARATSWLAQSATWLSPLLVVAAAAGWYRFSRTPVEQRRRTARHLGRSRWPIRRTLQACRLATFADLLAMMLRHGVPLGDAIVLAADASGDRGLGQDAEQVADQLSRGETFANLEQIPPAFPPLLGWLVLAANSTPSLPSTLQQLADGYRRDAKRAIALTTIGLPALCAAVAGGCIVLVHGVIVIGPVWRLMYDMVRTI